MKRYSYFVKNRQIEIPVGGYEGNTTLNGYTIPFIRGLTSVVYVLSYILIYILKLV